MALLKRSGGTAARVYLMVFEGENGLMTTGMESFVYYMHDKAQDLPNARTAFLFQIIGSLKDAEWDVSGLCAKSYMDCPKPGLEW